jgi:hypothetical protein
MGINVGEPIEEEGDFIFPTALPEQAHDFLEIDNRAELIKERDRMAKMMARVAEKKEG